jgi:hypothetical protein
MRLRSATMLSQQQQTGVLGTIPPPRKVPHDRKLINIAKALAE